MKTIVVVFLSGLVGLFIGGRLGYVPGSSSGKTAGALKGICEVVDTAVTAKVLPLNQAEKFGSTQVQTIKVSAQDAQDYLDFNTREGDVCRRIVNGIVQSTK
ncbi:hypothetical protein [Leptolyngbya sp. NIES-2104]|uniref:hypothetical protein n=1 Tax=Leptolyngbya sp. NIES-2104 TaxID=1552121 RepID=UPI0006EC5EB6|nr:hypothetical protein [Leptolyngbya sp. NIES-2104]GAP94287.1 hypothetical protein NIES2104_07980 [Leptolyngbya sp. NIES-2104]